MRRELHRVATGVARGLVLLAVLAGIVAMHGLPGHVPAAGAPAGSDTAQHAATQDGHQPAHDEPAPFGGTHDGPTCEAPGVASAPAMHSDPVPAPASLAPGGEPAAGRASAPRHAAEPARGPPVRAELCVYRI